MKTPLRMSRGTMAWAAVTTVVLLAGLANAEPGPAIQAHKVVLRKEGAGTEDEYSPAGGSGSNRKTIKIEAIEPIREKTPVLEVSWLGVSTDEASEVLASQLGLKSGQGLVVIYVAPESPAAKAGIQKHDVLVELGDQLLVHPAQLRKLVQMQKEGDTIKLTLHRGGKKQTVAATLAKRTEGLGMLLGEPSLDGDLPEFAFALAEAKIGARVREDLKTLHGSLSRAGIDQQTANVEVQRNMEEVRKAIQDALRQSAHATRAFGPGAKDLEALARGRVDVGNDASVTVTKDGAAVKTIVKSDEAGVYVIVASPKKRLTAHDKDGKLLFDGEIESQEQQEKVPAELWEKVKPMLQQIKPAEGGGAEPHAQSEGEPKI